MDCCSTKQGLNAGTVRKYWRDGYKYYEKFGLTWEAIERNYKTMMELGVGPRFKVINQHTIEMISGHTISKVIRDKIVGAEGKKEIRRQLE